MKLIKILLFSSIFINIFCAEVEKLKNDFYAALKSYKQEIEKIKELLPEIVKNNLINTRFPNDGDRTPLVLAAQNDNSAIVKLLLENKADPNLFGKDGYTPLHLAIFKKNEDMINELLAAKADPNIATIERITPLMTAAFLGLENIVKKLIELGANVNAQDFVLFTPAFKAIALPPEKRNKVISEIMAKEGFNPNILDRYGRTLIMLLVQYPDAEELIQKLIEKKIDLNIKDNYETTALLYAINAGKLSYVKILIEAGADPFLEGKINKSKLITPYEFANKKFTDTNDPIYKEIYEFIKEKKFFDPLYQAIKNEDLKLIKELLKEDSINIRDKNGVTPLIFAVLHNKLKVIDFLIRQNADPRISDNLGYNALTQAITNVNPESVEQILNSLNAIGKTEIIKELINMPDKSGVTPLQHAVLDDKLKIIDFLIRQGADPRITDNIGYNALTKGITGVHPEAIEQILNSLNAMGKIEIIDELINMPDGSGKKPLKIALRMISMARSTKKDKLAQIIKSLKASGAKE